MTLSMPRHTNEGRQYHTEHLCSIVLVIAFTFLSAPRRGGRDAKTQPRAAGCRAVNSCTRRGTTRSTYVHLYLYLHGRTSAGAGRRTDSLMVAPRPRGRRGFGRAPEQDPRGARDLIFKIPNLGSYIGDINGFSKITRRAPAFCSQCSLVVGRICEIVRPLPIDWHGSTMSCVSIDALADICHASHTNRPGRLGSASGPPNPQ